MLPRSRFPRERDLNERERGGWRERGETTRKRFSTSWTNVGGFRVRWPGWTDVEVVSNRLRRGRGERETLFVKCRVAV